MKGKPGEVRKYTTSMKAWLTDGTPFNAKGTGTDTIVKVDKDGNITIRESTHTEVEGFPPDPDDVTVSVLKPDGTTSHVSGANVGPQDYRLANLGTVTLPDFPLADGTKWAHVFPADSNNGGVEAKGQYAVLGSERLHNLDTWKIHFRTVELTGGAPARFDGTMWLSKTDALEVKEADTFKNIPIGDSSPTLSGTGTSELQ